jgi:hypothetical protein
VQDDNLKNNKIGIKNTLDLYQNESRTKIRYVNKLKQGVLIMMSQVANGIGLWFYMLFINPIISLFLMVGQLLGGIIMLVVLGCFLLLMASPFILAIFMFMKLGLL